MKEHPLLLAVVLLCAAGISAFAKVFGRGPDFLGLFWVLGALGAIIMGLVACRAKSLGEKVLAVLCALGGALLLAIGFLPALA
jgi:hypothetical protein